MERGTAPSDSLSMSHSSMKSLLARLGNPQNGRRTVHVTGSKGKGSTATMIASILQAAGQKTALYMSPHLHEYTERIQIYGQPVSPEEFADGIAQIREAVQREHESGDGPIVTFGILTALFFHLAKRNAVDWQVVEVGLGGELDATNVFDKKEVAVITPISVEHAAILGNSPAEIAIHKSGIILGGSTAVLSPQRDASVKTVVEARCRKVGARLIDVSEIYTHERLSSDEIRQSCRIGNNRRELNFSLSLLGQHQIANAATAVAVADAIAESDVNIADDAIVTGLARAHLPGRLEVLQRNPTVVVDGAHNAESAGVLCKGLQDHFQFRKCRLIVGVNKDKDVASMLEEFSNVADTMIATKSKNARSMPPDEIARHAEGSFASTSIAGSVSDAVRTALAQCEESDLILITGSLYLVAEARDHLRYGPPKRTPP